MGIVGTKEGLDKLVEISGLKETEGSSHPIFVQSEAAKCLVNIIVRREDDLSLQFKEIGGIDMYISFLVSRFLVFSFHNHDSQLSIKG